MADTGAGISIVDLDFAPGWGFNKTENTRFPGRPPRAPTLR